MKPIETTSMSNRMYSVLAEAIRRGGLTLDRMLQLNMTTAGSVCKRKYLRWSDAVDRFIPTPLGVAVKDAFGGTDVDRKDISRPLAKYIRTHVLDWKVRNIAESHRTRRHRSTAA